MRLTLIIIGLFILFSVSYGQSLTRHDNETAEMFVNRLKPDSSEFAHAVLETKSLNINKNIIVAFYEKTIYEVRQMPTYIDHDDYEIIIGYLYVPIGNNNYRKVLIDTISSDGGDPEIISVFFANADKDSIKELVVLCRYPQVHYDYGGDFYETFVYDNPTDTTERLTYLKELSEKFFGCDCDWRTEKKENQKQRNLELRKM